MTVMVVLGIDAHKRNHTAVAVDEAGRKYVRARMPNPEETTALALPDIAPVLETVLVTFAKCRPLLAETERTSAETVQLTYPVKQH